MGTNGTLNAAAVLSFCLVIATAVYAGPAAKVEEQVPVIVNIVDGSDGSKVEEAIRKANEALAKTNTRLVIKDVCNVNIGNGDDKLTRDEIDEALRKGAEEVAKLPGGRGVKLFVANNCWTQYPIVNGWAKHDYPVMGVEPDPNTQKLGRTIAHESIHIFTINYDLNSPNDINRLSYGTDSRGEDLTPAEINEVTKGAKKRGNTIVIMPKPMPGQSVAVPGIEYIIKGQGRVFDSFFDISCGFPGFDPCDVNYGYADLREISLFWDRPGDLTSDITFDLRTGGLFPDSFFDVFWTLAIDRNHDFTNEATVDIHVWGTALSLNTDGHLYDSETGMSYPLDVIIHENALFDGPGGIPIPSFHAIEVPIRAEYFFGPGSDPFDGQVCLLSANANDSRLGGYPMMDGTEPFDFGLSTPPPEAELDLFELYSPDGGGGGVGATGVHGTGFPPNGYVEIWMDGAQIGTTQAKADGTVTAEIPPTPDRTTHEVELVSKVYQPGGKYYVSAIGQFVSCPSGSSAVDLDNDCDTDLFDFAVLADNWLDGV